MKTYELNAWGETYNLTLGIDHYHNNGRLALQAYDEEDFPFATISVNLPNETYCPEGCFYVDANNCPWAEAWLEKNNIAQPTGYLACSGFCVYELYKLNPEAID